MSAPVRAVFFDVDFTLIHPGPGIQGPGYARFCQAHGVTGVDPDRFDAAVAASSFILDEVEEPVYDDDLFIHYTASIIEHMGGRGPQVIQAARDIYRQWAANHHFELYEDAQPTLDAIVARGLTVGVISNSHRSLAAFAEHFALERFITITVSSAEHGYMKPHRSIFDAALSQAGVDAEQAVMVGDSLRADIEGAVAAGLRAVLIRRSGERPDHLPPGVAVIGSLRDLPPLL